MKKHFLSLIILATVAVMATAQPETMRAFTAGGATQDNSYGVFGQSFGDILAQNGYEISEGVAQMQLMRDTTLVVLFRGEGEEYTWEGDNFSKHYDEVQDTIDSIYVVNGGEYNYDVIHYLYIITCEKQVELQGENYDVVILGGYCWTKQNLRYITGNEMLYNSDQYPSRNIDLTKYGYLYTWADATQGGSDGDDYVQGICPSGGWHIPDVTEMNAVKRLDATTIRTTTDWTTDDVNNNRTGFSAYPAGEFSAVQNRFQGMGTSTDWWTTTNTGSMATSLQVNYYCNVPMFVEHSVNDGLSVRCVYVPNVPEEVHDLYWNNTK